MNETNNLEQQKLDIISAKIMQYLPNIGINKKRELQRLIYEILKLQTKSFIDYQLEIDRFFTHKNLTFKQVKELLVKNRYPISYTATSLSPSIYLPEISFSNDYIADTTLHQYSPKTIYIEKQMQDSLFAQNIIKKFSNATIQVISTLNEYLKEQPKTTIQDFNARREKLFITSQKEKLFSKCPCSTGVRGCGYNNCNIGFGCIFDCTYCFLQEYTNTPGIIMPANLKDYYSKFTTFKKPNMRLGTGEFTDSLAFDHITDLSKELIPYFSQFEDVFFEFKTKSNTIDNLLIQKPSKNIVIGWSLNTQKMINENEFFTASLDQRLQAAKECSRVGYSVAFHFDPVILYSNWENEYKEIIERIFTTIDQNTIKWISIGTFRFKRELKPIIEKRFPQNSILDKELILGKDNKLRYPDQLRADVYTKMNTWFKKHTKNTYIYLCMESSDMWHTLS